MTITLDLPPHVEQGLIAKAAARGLSVADYLGEVAEREVVPAAANSTPPSVAPETDAKNLVELFENSPFKGLAMTFERDQDYGREIVL